MDVLKILRENVIDPVTEVHVNFISSLKYAVKTPHSHNFHELFLTTEGRVLHWINGECQLLDKGSLVLIRPDDIHYYEQYGDEDCQLVNLAFPSDILLSLFAYFGESFSPERLLKSKMPRQTVLTHIEMEYFVARVERLCLITYMDKTEIRIKFRSLLADIFSTHFSARSSAYHEEYTSWIELVYKEMQKKENFTVGISSMLHISGKSQEHLCRAFKKQYNKTPSEYINSLRLDYAANLLSYTDKKIIEISQEVGFECLSHFYHLFRKCFRQSPAEYRNTNRKTVIP